MRILPVRTALLSVYDKTGIVELARALTGQGVRILSTGGTATTLTAAGVALEAVEAVTGQAELFAGRVKTLHPVIHAGILARRHEPGDVALLERDRIAAIDLVVVTLYPFEATVAADPRDVAAALEKIDIGGPTMIRSAAKNHRDVCVITDPADYGGLAAELAAHGGVSEVFAQQMAVKAFRLTASYDAAIADYLGGARGAPSFGDRFAAGGPRLSELRYGENPHQQAAFYGWGRTWGLSAARVLQGRELSYNNLLDLDGALRAALEFSGQAAAVVVKHTNPCGVATAATLVEAYRTARDVDPVSAFGSVLAFNRPLDEATAREVAATFVECIICPAVDDAARAVLADKRNLRLLTLDPWPAAMRAQLDVRSVAGGLLVQDTDAVAPREHEWKVVSRRSPSEAEWAAMRFGWRVVKHIKSNAIVFAAADRALAIGAGQMSRVDSTRIAVHKARSPLQGSAVASDAFFPFRDGVDALAEAGATAVIQPGGSVRDAEVVAAADERDLAMVFTGTRHFKH